MSDDFQGRGGSPWGTPPGGGNGSGKGPTPPDIDALIRDIQSKINKFLTWWKFIRRKTNWFNFNYYSICMASKWTL